MALNANGLRPELAPIAQVDNWRKRYYNLVSTTKTNMPELTPYLDANMNDVISVATSGVRSTVQLKEAVITAPPVEAGAEPRPEDVATEALDGLVNFGRSLGSGEVEATGFDIIVARTQTLSAIADSAEASGDPVHFMGRMVEEVHDKFLPVLDGEHLDDASSIELQKFLSSLVAFYESTGGLESLSSETAQTLVELALKGHDEIPEGLAWKAFYQFHNQIFAKEHGEDEPEFLNDKHFTAVLLRSAIKKDRAEIPGITLKESLKHHTELATMMWLRATGFAVDEARVIVDSWASLEGLSDEQLKDLGPEATNEWTMGVFERNLTNIHRLESESPGMAMRLHRERGIANFGRYPFDLLLKQFNQLPDGRSADFLILPYSDHNGGLSRTAFDLDKAVPNGSEIIKIAEVSSAKELAQRASDLVGKYREADNIVIGGHGGVDRIEFGTETTTFGIPKETPHMALQDIKDALHHMIQFIKPGGNVILVSCSTGAEEGIGEEIASLLGNEVYAPTIPANVDVFHKNEDGRLQARYSKDATRRITPSNRRVHELERSRHHAPRRRFFPRNRAS